ncbi:CPBP family intramembrane metalloprotease [Bacillaceae bacterium Marseille-Q3522]|nr:CPBP family intramembrane metalloprotease [Bacillaceae bacterium Marseille-Q3522]
MYYSFQDRSIFWYIVTACVLFLISYSIFHEEIEDRISPSQYFIVGTISGLLLFGLFWAGFQIINLFHLPYINSIEALYKRFAPSALWHYIVLMLIIIPGEEIFWRGFVQKRLAKMMKTSWAIVAASLLYASVQLYSGFAIHFIAALIAGTFWGILYAWKKSMPLVIVSHLIFDLFLFLLLPFK